MHDYTSNIIHHLFSTAFSTLVCLNYTIDATTYKLTSLYEITIFEYSLSRVEGSVILHNT